MLIGGRMKLSACLAVLSLSSFAFSKPTSFSDTHGLLEERSPQRFVTTTKAPSTTTTSGTQTTSYSYGPIQSYGIFKGPIIPSIGPSTPTSSVSPSSGNSTSQDAAQNPYLPNSPQHRGNWLPGYDINTDYFEKWPYTGRTVRYTFSVAEATLAPDGVPKPMVVINGQYPGPLIEANWGDYIQITVTNNLKCNGTGIHWHGLRQLNSNTMDGVPGVTECPLAPGDTKTYYFQATQYGSSWYHSHFSLQYGDGAVGPILIHGPSSANYDIDLGTVLVSDYYDCSAWDAGWYADRNGPPKAKNYMINGQNVALDGSTGQRAKFTFVPGKKHLIRVINTSMDALFKMSIDGHTLTVVQTDFVPIVPYTTNEVAIHVAQRHHIIVEANQTPGNYYFRAMAAMSCVNIANPGNGTANAVVEYANSPSPGTLPKSTMTNHSDTCLDEPMASMVPIQPRSVDPTNFAQIAQEKDINPVIAYVPDKVFKWTLGGNTLQLDWGQPTIAQAYASTYNWTGPQNVVTINSTNQWTFWIIQNNFFVPHPMHLHGHDFSLLGQGNGHFNPSSDPAKLSWSNPPRRDVVVLPASGWVVIAFRSDNPGAWVMHCHIAWHAGEGLSLQFLERPQDIQKTYQSQITGTSFQSVCKNWRQFALTMEYPMSDSGLRKREAGDTSLMDIIHAREAMYAGRRSDRNIVRRRW